MPLGDFLNAENKTAALEELRNQTFRELYVFCIKAQIDPDLMDYETWELPEVSNNNVAIHHFYKVIERFCESLKMIDEKIGKAS
jgi:hypothetical protein